MHVQTQFFTLWVFVLVCLAPITTKYINVLLLSTVVFLVGNYFSFVEPGFYTLDNDKTVCGWKRFWFVDVLMHFLPWLFILWFQGKEGGTLPAVHEKWRGTLVVVVLYLIAYPPWEIDVYHVPFWKMASLLFASTSIYGLLAHYEIPLLGFVSTFQKVQAETQSIAAQSFQALDEKND